VEKLHESRTDGFHLAGIVPVSGLPKDLAMPWDPSLTQVGDKYTAIERSVLDCSQVGCNTIWIVCNDDVQPLIKDRLGDWVYDTRTVEGASKSRRPEDLKKKIPIFYTPIHPRDRDRRDSLGWSVLHGALTAFLMSSKMSKWLVPDRYFVSFPCAVIPKYSLSGNRIKIRSSVPTVVEYQGKSIADGLYLPFTFDAEEYKHYLTKVKQGCTGGNKSIPVEDRWSSRHFTLKEIFAPIGSLDTNKIEVKSYYPIDNWDNYVVYMRSDIAAGMYAPVGRYLTYKTYGKIKFDELENLENEEAVES
tara:strand:+ start:6712 stop:7620 length:909 start_codon:yes stop_codon:yes gene_type:complete